MSHLFMALGLVFAVEGLLYAVAPSTVEKMLELLRAMPLDQRRLVGLASMAAGIALVWLARALGA